jgi:hypothetical protein
MRREKRNPGRRRALIVASVVLAAALRGSLGASESPFDEAARLAIRERTGLSMEVRAAVLRAWTLLEDPRCREIFAEFRDTSNRPLQVRLDDLGETGRSFLARIDYSDASETEECRVPSTLAATVPGRATVAVCASKFRILARRDFERLAVVILHEELHALGLGENPPSSAEISRRIALWCR